MQSIKTLIIISLLFISNCIIAQEENNSFVLIDQNKGMPVEGASYEYGTQKGTTDSFGNVTIVYNAEDTLYISHLSYGRISLYGQSVYKLLNQKKLYLKSKNYELYPMSVISLHKETSSIDINYPEKIQHDGAAILNQLPSFSSIRKGGNYGFDPVFRGYKYEQLNIVLNGAQSAIAACPNRMDPPTSQMTPNMIDQIEILKGPHALRYGTGFGATVNFITDEPKFTNKTEKYGRLSTGYENNANIYRGETKIGMRHKKYDANIIASWSQGNDYETANHIKIPSGFVRASVGTNIAIKLTKNQILKLLANLNKASDSDFPSLGMDLRKDETKLFNLNHKININGENLKSWKTDVFGSFVNHLMDNLLKELNPRMMNASTTANTSNYGIRTESNWQIAGADNLFLGADSKFENVDGTRTREFLMGKNKGKSIDDTPWQDAKIQKTSLFAEYHFNMDRLNFIFSSRLEINNADLGKPDEDFLKINPEIKSTHINPNFSVGIQRHFDENIRLGFFIGRAQRSAGLAERFINYFTIGQDPYEIIGNPQLKPEVNNQIDLTFLWKNSDFNLNIDIFSSYMTDYITSIKNPNLKPKIAMNKGVRNMINIGKSFKAGFEINYIQNLIYGIQHKLGIAYTYAQNIEDNTALPEIAPIDVRYSLKGNYFEEKLSPEISFRFVGKQDRISQDFGETETPSFRIVDVKMAYTVYKNLNIQVGISNVFNENYYEHLSRSVLGNRLFYAPGRNFFTNLSYNF